MFCEIVIVLALASVIASAMVTVIIKILLLFVFSVTLISRGLSTKNKKHPSGAQRIIKNTPEIGCVCHKTYQQQKHTGDINDPINISLIIIIASFGCIYSFTALLL